MKTMTKHEHRSIKLYLDVLELTVDLLVLKGKTCISVGTSLGFESPMGPMRPALPAFLMREWIEMDLEFTTPYKAFLSYVRA